MCPYLQEGGWSTYGKSCQCSLFFISLLNDLDYQENDSNVSLFDIIFNLFPSAVTKLRNMVDILDAPENGMMIANNLHSLFDDFAFCLMVCSDHECFLTN